jgi:nicotinate dehydrogenase subunit A
MRTQALLESTPDPSDDQIRRELVIHQCRCGTHIRILRAVRRAADSFKAASAPGETPNG